MVKTEMRIDKKSLNLRAMGISNWARDVENNKLYSVQFYDYDNNGKGEAEFRKDIKRIMEIFPLDCLMYTTKHGIHFISFGLRYGLRYTKAKALETSREIGDQDYWTEQKDLTLRISPKWEVKRKLLSHQYKIISKKPKFKGLIKEPNNYRISQKHLEFYFKYMDLPLWVYNKYKDCEKFNFKIKVCHYKTRD